MRHPIKIIVLGLFLYLCPPWLWGEGSAFAQSGSATVNYAAPTTRVGGGALAASEILGYRVEYGSCSGTAFGVKAGEMTPTPATALTATVPNLAPGTYCFRAFAKDQYGQWSDPSNVGTKTIPLPPPPSPPAIVTISVVAGVNISPAFRVLADGSRSSTVVGLVGTGATCSGPVLFTYRGKSYRRVDPAAVRWWATAPTTNVAAACA